MIKKEERNYNIDFLRGIAVLSIIFIHTAFWSGEKYLPNEFRCLFMLIDVPAFIFISGISFNYVNSIIKNLVSLLKMWKKYLFFLIFYFLILFIFFRSEIDYNEIFSWLVYIFPTDNSLKVFGGSMWFMIMYMKVSILCSIIICSVNYFVKEKKVNCLITCLGVLLFIFFYCSNVGDFLFFNSELSFYSLIYLFGYISFSYKIKDIKQLFLYEMFTIIIFLFLGKVCHIDFRNIQNIKFPPSFLYLFFSLIFIILFWFLKDNLKIKNNNKLCYLGKNAIVFYFCQGIGSSLLFLILPYVVFKNYLLKFLILLIFNMIFTIISGILFNKIYNFVFESNIFKNKLEFIYPIKKN